VGSPTKRELKNSTAAVAPVVPPPPEQPSHHKPKSAKLPAASRAPAAAPSTFTVPERQGDRRDSDNADDDDPANDVLLRSLAVRQRYGCSDMWIHRRLTDASGFPRPIYIAGIRHWRLSDLLVWERAQAELPVPKPRILEHHDRALAALASQRVRRKAEQAETAREPLDAGGAQSSA
jgi:hypothetical protein